jgi:hypothetical protein
VEKVFIISFIQMLYLKVRGRNKEGKEGTKIQKERKTRKMTDLTNE